MAVWSFSMRRSAFHVVLVIGSLAGGIVGSKAASFDCGKATSSTERMICSHRELGIRDEMMARLYAAAQKQDESGKLKDAQRRWLSKLQACTDADCISHDYDERIEQLLRNKSAQTLATTFHTDGSNGNDGTLIVYGPYKGLAEVSLSATYVGPKGIAAGDVNADGASGMITLRDGRGRLDANGCLFRFHQEDARSWHVSQSGKCVLASGVTLEGSYSR
jgi:uncharacterized protein YecT (DUF1311 family)